MWWRAKLTLKLLSGRIPVLKRALQRAGYFRLGKMEQEGYAEGVFARHFAVCAEGAGNRGTCLEVGPGDSLFTVLLARAAGFERVVLVDAGWQAGRDLRPYQALARRLRANGHDVPEVDPHGTMESFLEACGGVYLTGGLRSLDALETGSIDFSFSHAVLEHLPRAETGAWLRQLRRVARSPALSSHVVDLRDHLGGSLQHLRFSSSFWEGPSLRRSGLYTNRLRLSDWMRLFGEAGWKPRLVERYAYPSPPVDPRGFAPEFRRLDASDLLTHGFQVTLEGV